LVLAGFELALRAAGTLLLAEQRTGRVDPATGDRVFPTIWSAA
jgi:hypothetical protein